MRLICAAVLVIASIPAAYAHDEYLGTKDPVTGRLCCSTSAGDSYGDCDVLQVTPANLTAEADGYRVILTLEEARQINPFAMMPVDQIVPWDRVQDAKDGRYRICVNRWGQVICFFAPANT